MQEKRTDIVKIQGVIKTIPSHQQLMKVNRQLMGAVIFLMLLVFILGAIFLPKQDIVTSYQKINPLAVAANGMNPVISPEVNTLKGQFIGLVSGSIENKLNTLENSIKSGTLNHSLGTIEDLKEDIRILRSYSELTKKPDPAVSNLQLAEEISQLKHLIYTTLASCGLMFVAAVGVWVKMRKRLPHHVIKGILGKR